MTKPLPQIGDTVRVTGTVDRISEKSFWLEFVLTGRIVGLWLDPDDNYELIERPWKVGDRFRINDLHWLILSIDGGYVWAKHESDSYRTTLTPDEMRSAKRLPRDAQ